MDPRRIILMAGLAIVTYMLILNWNQDYSVKHENVTQQPSAASSSAPSLASPQIEDQVVATGEKKTSANSDAPVVESTQPVQTTTTESTNIIEVSTDVLKVNIDLLGGDIVYLALPQYSQSLETPDIPFDLLERSDRLFYIAQSGLAGKNGIDKSARAMYQAEKTTYKLEDGQEQLVVDLRYTHNSNDAIEGVSIVKRYTFTPGSYLVDVSFVVDNQSDATWSGNLYGQLKRDNSSDPGSQSSMFSVASFLGAAYSSDQENFEKVDFDDLGSRDSQIKHESQGGWIGILQHYFLTSWVPNKDATVNYYGRKSSGQNVVGFFYSKPLTVAPQQTDSVSTKIYAGPKIQDDLEEIAPFLDLSVDYGILFWLAKPLFWLLQIFHDLFGNWGWAIIGVTVVVKIIFIKPSAMSYRSTANLRRVAPKMEALKARYADDKQKLGQEMMALYRKEKVNPMGGCLPILIQMPVFIALYWVLMESVELRQAPWILWIEDLSVADPYFILPILMGVTMWGTMQFSPKPTDPVQAKVMKFMPIVFTFLFLGFPAGLVLYWVVNSILSLIQQYVITKKIESEAK